VPRALEVFSSLEGLGLALGLAGTDKVSVLGSQNKFPMISISEAGKRKS
jgi:hypothetical protein